MSAPQSFDEAIHAWQDFCAKNDWQKLVEGVKPKQTGCGPVYELPNYLKRPNEQFAICDMRKIRVCEPHYHSGGEIEIYFVIQGQGLVVVGEQEHDLGPGDAVVTPPEHVHFTIPRDGFVIGLINIPGFAADRYITVPVNQDDPQHKFSSSQFKRLSL